MSPPKLRVIQGGKVVEADGRELAQKILIERDGPHCAGWLAHANRRTLRRKGYFIVKIPRGVLLPTWFTIALGCFKKRSSRWEVEEKTKRTATGKTADRFFTIRYRRHQHFTPAHAWN